MKKLVLILILFFTISIFATGEDDTEDDGSKCGCSDDYPQPEPCNWYELCYWF